MSDLVATLKTTLAALEAKVADYEARLGIESSAGEDSGPSPQAVAFDALIAEHVTAFTKACDDVGGACTALGDIVKRAFAETRNWIDMSSKCKKPSVADKGALLAALSAICKEASNMYDRSSPFANHIKTVADGLPACSWVVHEPPQLPGDWASGCQEAAEFYANKVRMEYRNKDKKHVVVMDAFKKLLLAQVTFVKSNFKTGLEWNPRGKAATAGGSKPSNNAGAGAGAGSGASAAGASSAPAGGRPKISGGMASVFGQIKAIDQSKGKTEGLRHVSKDMKSKSTGGVVAAKPKPKARVKDAPKGEPKIYLVQKRWIVENQGEGAPVEIKEGVDREKEVYISGCVGATIIVPDKAKAMTIDNCRNTQVVFGSLLSSCEVVNCKRVKIQTKGSCRAFAIDKTDGIIVYLSHESRNAHIVTSKSSEMNVSFPTTAAEDADWVEMPIPEQFLSTVGEDNKVHSRVSELYG